MEQRTFKNVSNCLNTNIYSSLETSGGQSCNPYLNAVHFFSAPELIRNLWQLKTVVFLHCCLICAVPLPFFTKRPAKIIKIFVKAKLKWFGFGEEDYSKMSFLV
jgi:hypothetical protein